AMGPASLQPAVPTSAPAHLPLGDRRCPAEMARSVGVLLRQLGRPGLHFTSGHRVPTVAGGSGAAASPLHAEPARAPGGAAFTRHAAAVRAQGSAPAGRCLDGASFGPRRRPTRTGAADVRRN